MKVTATIRTDQSADPTTVMARQAWHRPDFTVFHTAMEVTAYVGRS